MQVKTTAGEYDRFMDADWTKLGLGEEPYIEEDAIYVNGDLDENYEPGKHPPESKLTILGTIRDGKEGQGSEKDLGRAFKNWQKSQTTGVILIEVDTTVRPRDEWKTYLQEHFREREIAAKVW
jgi:hypothetical protein